MSKTPDWTPEPWEVGLRRDGSIWLSLGNPASGRHYQGDIVCTFSDAKLMASAVKLYEALDELLCWLGPGSAASLGANCETLMEAKDKAIAAIARARGLA